MASNKWCQAYRRRLSFRNHATLALNAVKSWIFEGSRAATARKSFHPLSEVESSFHVRGQHAPPTLFCLEGFPSNDDPNSTQSRGQSGLYVKGWENFELQRRSFPRAPMYLIHKIGNLESDDWQYYQTMMIFQTQMHTPEGTVLGYLLASRTVW